MRALLLAFVLVLVPVAVMAQGLTVVGPDGQTTELSAEVLAKLPRAEATLRAGDKATPYQGLALTTVLREAGVPVGVKLHGKPLASFVVVTGEDGYRAVLSIAETDAWITGTPVILADRKAGGALAPEEGAWRLVIGADRRPERSVRDVVKIEVKAAP